MCPKLIEVHSWNGPTVHVCCFMLARASTKTFVSRVQKTAKKSSLAEKFVSRVIVSRGITVYFRAAHSDTNILSTRLGNQTILQTNALHFWATWFLGICPSSKCQKCKFSGTRTFSIHCLTFRRLMSTIVDVPHR